MQPAVARRQYARRGRRVGPASDVQHRLVLEVELGRIAIRSVKLEHMAGAVPVAQAEVEIELAG